MKFLRLYKTNCFLLLCFLFLHGQICAEGSSPKWIVSEEFLSKDLDHFDCHSSSIVETLPGHYCVVWKGGVGEGECNKDMRAQVGVWLSLFHEDGWSEPIEVVSIPDGVCWNPVLSKLPSGELLLFYRIGSSPRQAVSFVKRSYDGGYHWSEGEILPAGIIGPTKNKPIVTPTGALISPSSVEVGEFSDPFKATACWIEISKDGARHWKKFGPLEISTRKFGVIEPALFFDLQGRLRMVCRDRANKVGEKGYIWTAISMDEGVSWSSLQKTELPNPDSGIETIDLGKGWIVLIYNHSHLDRHPLHLAFSTDGGDHWSFPLVVDNSGEFPAGILASDGLIHLTYATKFPEQGQRRIKHIVINPNLLK